MDGQHSWRRVAALSATAALVVTGGGAAAWAATGGGDGPTAQAAAASHVVISEAYLSGGSANAPYTTKFVELFNPTGQAVSVDGWSVQYRPATGTGASTSTVALTGSIAAGGHYLVAGGSNGATGAALPTPDASGAALNPSGSAGTIALASTTDKLTLPTGSVTGDAATAARVVDLVGYGTSNTYEGHPVTGLPANTTPSSLQRAGGTDTDDNAADLTVGTTVTPQNTADGGSTPTDPPTTPPAGGTTAAIAEVQGTTDTSPYVGKTVTTRGVVTAAYPTGGYNGLYIQTPGTGGDVDLATHHASDGLFVYSTKAAADLKPGQYVEVTGTVSEYSGLTELSATTWSVLPDAVPAVKPATVAFPQTDAQRESLEGMLVAPAGHYVVADNYDTNYYGSFLLAAGDKPFVQPTQAGRPGSAEAQAAVTDRAARAVVLDDGATTNYSSAANTSKPLPYLTGGKPARVGAHVTFTTPVILDYRYDAWAFEPLAQLTPDVADAVQPVTFENTRTDAPQVAGTLHVSSFNVLNYFTTTGDQLSGCQPYTDRQGNPITVKTGCNARGAWDAANLQRQQTKIVNAINGLGADVVSLEEIENSLTTDGEDRDASLAQLTDALNAATGAGTWKYVPSPANLPADEDVIRVAFIYKPAVVKPVGASQLLVGSTAFDGIARQPLAQTWRPVGGGSKDDVVVVSNHFKSKGTFDGDNPGPGDTDAGDGQGAYNATRVKQAQATLAFANAYAKAAKTDKILLVGDFNAYGQEDPVKAITDAGYTDLGATTGKQTYLFDGYVGSIDHAFASASLAGVAKADIWNINSVEPIANEYSRYNYNVSNLYDTTPFRSSDHDPILVGLDLPVKSSHADVTLKALTAKAFCSAGKAYVSTSVVAGEPKHALDLRLTTSYGDQKFTKVAPLTSVSQVFATGKAAIPAGTLSVAGYYWDGAGHYQVETKAYQAKDCR
ncbi:MAG TPA: ExeM/NucH family extracellular endonuclease [Luteimicrobium sp.]|nr:ExeM/NucH family extracellular endonuclease [Luteimicrobium sp.]